MKFKKLITSLLIVTSTFVNVVSISAQNLTEAQINDFVSKKSTDYKTETVDSNVINDKIIEEDFALKIAYNFLDSRNYNSYIEKLPSNYRLIKDLTLYESSNIPSAYKFNIVDEKDDYNGYIIIGAQESYAPIIEYGFSDTKNFLNNLNTYEKVYYVGGINYFIVDTRYNIARNVNDDKILKIDQLNLDFDQNEYNSSFDYSVMWNEVYDDINRNIENPGDVESGYNKLSIATLRGGSSADYKLMSEFGNGGICGPIAALNMMILGNDYYDLNLKYINWTNTYNKLFDLSNCDLNIGTFTKDLKNGIDDYINNVCGYNSVYVASNSINSADELMQNINNSIFQIILLENHYYYNNHFVFVFGYEKYEYDNYSNTYFAIADGRNSGRRYIPYNNSEFLDVITVDF